MKKLIRTTYNPYYMDWALLVIRITVACFMLIHGLPKLSKFCSNEDVQFADPIGVGVIFSLALTVFAEVVCSVLIFVGLATRLVVIPIMMTMLVAAFVIHGGDGFGQQELSLLYLLIYGFLMVTGSGKFSIDQWLHNRSETKNQKRD